MERNIFQRNAPVVTNGQMPDVEDGLFMFVMIVWVHGSFVDAM
jgi:hypothetical protein